MASLIEEPSKNRKDEESSEAKEKEIKRFMKSPKKILKKLLPIIIVAIVIVGSLILYRDIIYGVVSQHYHLIPTIFSTISLSIVAIIGIITIKKVIEELKKTEKIYENLKEMEKLKNINELLGKTAEQLKQIVDSLPTNERINEMEENITETLNKLDEGIKEIPTEAKINEIAKKLGTGEIKNILDNMKKIVDSLPTNERINKMEENITKTLNNLDKTLSNQCSNIVRATYDIALGEILSLYIDSVYEDIKKVFRNNLNSIGQKLSLKSVCDDITSRLKHQNIYVVDKIALLAQLEYCEDNYYVFIDKKFKENYERSVKNELRSIVNRALDEKKINLQNLVNNICGGSKG